MNNEQLQPKSAENPAAKMEQESSPETSSEEIGEKMISDSQQEVADFAQDSSAGLKSAEEKAAADGLEVDLRDKEELRMLDKEAQSAQDELSKGIFGKVKSGMKKAVAIGMATMTLSGAAGNFSNNEAVASEYTSETMIDSSPDDPRKVIKLGEMVGDLEVSSFDSNGNTIKRKYVADYDRKKNMGGNKNEALYGDMAIEYMLKHIASNEYLKKLTIEVNGDVERAKKIQAERLANIQSVGIKYFKDTRALSDDVNEANLDNDGADSRGAYDTQDHIVLLQKQEKDKLVSIHESSHASTRAEKGIPSETVEKLNIKNFKRYESLEDKDGTIKNYYYTPAEILARKQAIDFELERLGIKEYGEECSEKHLLQLLIIEAKRVNIVKSDWIPASRQDIADVIFSDLEKSGGVIRRNTPGIEFVIMYGLDKSVEMINEIAMNKRSPIQMDVEKVS
mgnify:CR=1 FL=1